MRIAATIASFVMLGASAQAATITRDYSFTLYDFQDGLGVEPPPVDPIIGSFTLTFDPAVAVSNATSGLVVHGVNTPVDGYFAFSWTPGLGLLRLGGIISASDDVSTFFDGTNDFGLSFFDPLSGSPTGLSGAYRRADSTGFWIAETGAVEAATAVPEPSAWTLMILGFAAGGAGLRHVRRRDVTQSH